MTLQESQAAEEDAESRLLSFLAPFLSARHSLYFSIPFEAMQ
jgi:hypothetical protein